MMEGNKPHTCGVGCLEMSDIGGLGWRGGQRDGNWESARER